MAQPRQLMRSSTDVKIAGVCGGVAEYFELDPMLVRIGFLFAVLAGFGGLLVYVIMWIVLPKAPAGSSVPPARQPGRGAIEIAEERYARGEITADELARIRADLAG
jgi:phage shock protein C